MDDCLSDGPTFAQMAKMVEESGFDGLGIVDTQIGSGSLR